MRYFTQMLCLSSCERLYHQMVEVEDGVLSKYYDYEKEIPATVALNGAILISTQKVDCREYGNLFRGCNLNDLSSRLCSKDSPTADSLFVYHLTGLNLSTGELLENFKIGLL